MAKRSSSLTDKLADTILNRIVSQELRPGSPLPSERDLQEEFGVSRTVVREAMKMLSAKGFVSTGAGHNAIVETNLTQPTIDALLITFHHRRVKTGDLLNTRLLLEPPIAALAAQHAAPLQITRLLDLSHELEQSMQPSTTANNTFPQDYAADADSQFHITLAQASQNPANEVLIEMLVGILWQHERFNYSTPSPEQRMLAVQQHIQIAQAVAERDAVAASRCMTEHLEATQRHLFGMPASLRDLVQGHFANTEP
jgi:DNA-binding FadR family transcriptional regulator